MNDAAILPDKHWIYLKKGDVVWAKFGQEAWPAVVSKSCTKDAQIAVDWLGSNSESCIDPSPSTIERFHKGGHPTERLRPMDSQKQRDQFKKLREKKTFQTAIEAAEQKLEEKPWEAKPPRLKAGDKVSFYPPNEAVSKESLRTCTIIRVNGPALIQREHPIELDNSLYQLSVDDEVFFENLDSKPLSKFVFVEGELADHGQSNSVVNSLNRHRKNLAEKTPNGMSNLLLQSDSSFSAVSPSKLRSALSPNKFKSALSPKKTKSRSTLSPNEPQPMKNSSISPNRSKPTVSESEESDAEEEQETQHESNSSKRSLLNGICGKRSDILSEVSDCHKASIESNVDESFSSERPSSSNSGNTDVGVSISRSIDDNVAELNSVCSTDNDIRSGNSCSDSDEAVRRSPSRSSRLLTHKSRRKAGPESITAPKLNLLDLTPSPVVYSVPFLSLSSSAVSCCLLSSSSSSSSATSFSSSAEPLSVSTSSSHGQNGSCCSDDEELALKRVKSASLSPSPAVRSSRRIQSLYHTGSVRKLTNGSILASNGEKNLVSRGKEDYKQIKDGTQSNRNKIIKSNKDLKASAIRCDHSLNSENDSDDVSSVRAHLKQTKTEKDVAENKNRKNKTVSCQSDEEDVLSSSQKRKAIERATFKDPAVKIVQDVIDFMRKAEAELEAYDAAQSVKAQLAHKCVADARFALMNSLGAQNIDFDF